MTTKHKICIPIQASSLEEFKKMLIEAEKEADFIEIWLDHLKGLKISEIPSIIKMVKTPLIVVCKGRKEKGRWTKSEKERVEFLKVALKAGADYADIGIHTDKKLIKELKKEGKIIISFHDFKKTPRKSNLDKIAKEARALGADIVKIATFANNKADNLAVLEVVARLSYENEKVIGLCMGKEGKLSRIHSTEFGGFLMFASLGKASAPGQLTVKELKKAWAKLR